jgi:hypothetical protein
VGPPHRPLVPLRGNRIFSHVVLLYIVEHLHFLYDWNCVQEVVAHEVGVQLWYNVGSLHL